MRSIFFSLIFVSLAAHATSSPLTGKWILQSKEIKATSGDCHQVLAIKGNLHAIKVATVLPGGEDFKQKFSDYGRDGRVNGGCASGTSWFTFESWHGCSWDMTHVDSFDNGRRILITNYRCEDKTCAKRSVNVRGQYEIQNDDTLLFTDRYLQGTEMQKMNCRYIRQ